MTNDAFGICLEPKCEEETPQPALPSAYEQLKGFLSSAKSVVGSAMAGEGVLVDEATYEARMGICSTCEFLRKDDLRCSKCGCFMKNKSMFKSVGCPEHKWGAV
jgi:hypothetical protein